MTESKKLLEQMRDLQAQLRMVQALGDDPRFAKIEALQKRFFELNGRIANIDGRDALEGATENGH